MSFIKSGNHLKPQTVARPVLAHEQNRHNLPKPLIQPKRAPSPPPVYRPGVRSIVLQPKAPIVQQKTSAVHRPIAPPVFKPKHREVVQPKLAVTERKPVVAPPVYRPELKRTVQPKAMTANQASNPAKAATRPSSPPTLRTVQKKPAITESLPNGRNGASRQKPITANTTRTSVNKSPQTRGVVQRMIGFEYEVGAINVQKHTSWVKPSWGQWVYPNKGEVLISRSGYDITADLNDDQRNLEFITKPIDETAPGAISRIRQMARDIASDLKAIYDASVKSKDPESWVGANEIPRLNGWWWHRFQNRVNSWNAVNGQLQMTGGVSLNKIWKVLSGSALGQEPAQLQGEAEVKHDRLRSFYQSNPAAEAKQPIYRRAMLEVNNRFAHRNAWQDISLLRMLASAITLMATIPIEKRGGFENNRNALLLAKTDYSKILHMVVERAHAVIPETPFLNALLATVNAFVPVNEAVNSASSVLPAYHSVNGNTFTELTFGDWVAWALPEVDPLAEEFGETEFLQGMDRLTSKEFPGSEAKKKEMRAYGTFGSKTDPGSKVIFEFRNLTTAAPSELEASMAGIAKYLRRDVNG
ncbi:MAG TPA: hypothetical protein VFC63_03075 [Blastocatellia bacterium]|nr:hypothetical protein [Blastocatellia bacterium]